MRPYGQVESRWRGWGGYKDQAAIEDDSDDEGPKKVDAKEVKKYIALIKGAFEDISKITNQY